MRVLYIILMLFMVGCTPNPTVNKREVSLEKVKQINHNPRTDALVIGVGKYKNNIRPLYGVEKDLVNIKKLFNYLNIKNITTLQNERASLKGVREAFNSYIHSDKNRKGNRFVFYYSGHGVQVIDENGDEKDKKDEATALFDVNLNDKGFITEGVLLDDELHSLLAQIDSKKILIFDKCHSGSSHRGYNPYIKAVEGEYKLSPPFLKEIKNNIKSQKPLKDFIIFSATKDDQEAEDSPLGGLFTNSFIDGIYYRKADNNSDNKITVAELEKFCATNIANLAVNIPKLYKDVTLKGKFDPHFAPKEARNRDISSIFNIKQKTNSNQKEKYLLENTLDSLVSSDTLQLLLMGNKTEFRINDRVRFEITSNKSGYLNIFIAYKDSYRLFMKNKRIEANKLYAFPNDFMTRKHLVAKRPLGETKIYTLLSRKPLKIKEYLSKKENDLNLTNYIRKGIMIIAKREQKKSKSKKIVKKANILSINKVIFEVK